MDVRRQDNNLFSVKTYDYCAEKYEQWFMDISPYKAHVDEFCNSLPSLRSKLLDLGCGPGNYSKYLLEVKGFRNVDGIDLSEEMIKRAKKNVPAASFNVGDIRKLTLQPSSYHGILASFCVPYLSYHDTDKLIADCYRILKPSGTLYISCMEGVNSGFEQTSFSGEMAVYVYYYMEDFLVTSMEEKGFHVVRVDRQSYLAPDGILCTDLVVMAQKP